MTIKKKGLSKGQMLQRAPGLRVEIDASESLRVFMQEDLAGVECSKHGLGILEVFAQPVTMGQGVEELQSRTHGAQDWMDLMDTVVDFHRLGILRDPHGEVPRLNPQGSGYDSAPVHVAMLNDRARTAAFLQGIREVVQPGDVVVDLGTGTGVLAAAAAQAGAKHVYAVEASAISQSAKALFAANGVADRITVIHGWSTQVELPQKADVLVSEMVGSEPLDESILEMTTDARKRLLVPNARMVPQRLRVFALPLMVPRENLQRYLFLPENTDRWRQWYGIDFSPLVGIGQQSPQNYWLNPYDARSWPVVGQPLLLADLDLEQIDSPRLDRTVQGVAEAAGEINGLLIFFDLDLSANTHFSTHPDKAPASNHWRSPLWLLAEGLVVEEGTLFEIGYRHRISGPQISCRLLK